MYIGQSTTWTYVATRKILVESLKKIIFGNKHMVPSHGKRWDQIRPAGYQIKLPLK